MEAKNFMEEKPSIEKTQSMEEKELHVVKKHKDTVFRMLYNDREKLLQFSPSIYQPNFYYSDGRLSCHHWSIPY